MTYTFMDRIGVLFDPRFWIRHASVSHEFGETIERALDAGDVSVDGALVVGGHTLMSCRDYSLFGAHVWFDCMPPRKTALRLRAYVDMELDRAHALADMAEEDARLGLLDVGMDDE